MHNSKAISNACFVIETMDAPFVFKFYINYIYIKKKRQWILFFLKAILGKRVFWERENDEVRVQKQEYRKKWKREATKKMFSCDIWNASKHSSRGLISSLSLSLYTCLYITHLITISFHFISLGNWTLYLSIHHALSTIIHSCIPFDLFHHTYSHTYHLNPTELKLA